MSQWVVFNSYLFSLSGHVYWYPMNFFETMNFQQTLPTVFFFFLKILNYETIEKWETSGLNSTERLSQSLPPKREKVGSKYVPQKDSSRYSFSFHFMLKRGVFYSLLSLQTESRHWKFLTSKYLYFKLEMYHFLKLSSISRWF